MEIHSCQSFLRLTQSLPYQQAERMCCCTACLRTSQGHGGSSGKNDSTHVPHSTDLLSPIINSGRVNDTLRDRQVCSQPLLSSYQATVDSDVKPALWRAWIMAEPGTICSDPCTRVGCSSRMSLPFSVGMCYKSLRDEANNTTEKIPREREARQRKGPPWTTCMHGLTKFAFARLGGGFWPE